MLQTYEYEYQPLTLRLACCGVVFTFFTPVSPGPAARTRIIYISIFCHQKQGLSSI